MASDAGRTGRFEVTINDQLVHSKSTLGHGKCESPAELAAITEKIAKLLKD
jgi:hypothetical protein